MTSALEQRAEVELLHLIETERSRRSRPRTPPWQSARTYYYDAPEAGTRERESFRFSLEALAAIGALSETEIVEWMARFDAEATGRERWPEVARDPDVERRARDLLENRLPASNLASQSEDYKRAIWHFQEAQGVVNITGALSHEERAQWHERFLERVSPEDRRRLHNPPQCRGVDLVRVIPGPPVRHDGLRITHVELYTDGVIIHWHHSVEYPPGRALMSWESFQASKPDRGAGMLELADDAETAYRWWPGPSHDAAFRKDGFVHWLSATFTPAVPEEATRLVASREGKAFDIPLI